MTTIDGYPLRGFGGSSWFRRLIVSVEAEILKQMPSKAKKLLITTVSHEVFVVRVNQQAAAHGYCTKCEAEVEMLSLDAAVDESGVSGRELIRQLASEEIHTLENDNGHLLVCRNSLR